MLHTSVFLLYQQTYSFNSYVNCHFSLNSRYDQELKKEKQRIKDRLVWKTGTGTQMIVLLLQIIKQVKSGLV